MGFPSQVNVQPANGQAGDFASSNPRSSVPAGPGGFVAGPNGVTQGYWGWADSNMLTVSNTGVGAPHGIVRRGQDGLITTWLADNTRIIPAGMALALFNGGDFWIKNSGTSAVTVGMKAYANNATGACLFAATATPPSAFTGTGSIAANSGSASSIAAITGTATFSGTTMTVSAATTGALCPGVVVNGTGINPATTVVAQLTGTAGSTGTYQVSVSQTIGVGVAFTCPYHSTLTVGGTVTGTFVVGQTLTGSTTAAGTTIIAPISGTGGAGTYGVTIQQTVSSAALTASGGTLTITAVSSGNLIVGGLLSGTNVTGSPSLTAILTGTGGVGTYLVNVSETAASGTVYCNAATETTFYAVSAGAAGEHVKISTIPA